MRTQLDNAIAVKIKLERLNGDLKEGWEVSVTDCQLVHLSSLEVHKRQRKIDDLKKHLAVELERKYKVSYHIQNLLL